MDPLFLLLICLPVAGLISWRLLTGSHHEKRHERNAATSMAGMVKRSRPSDAIARVALPRSRYSAVSLRICNNPCKAALDLHGKSMLLGEEPALPLPGCNRTCHCEYAQHNDRRIHKDRRYPAADIVDISGSNELPDKRTGSDRRRRKAGREPYQGIY